MSEVRDFDQSQPSGLAGPHAQLAWQHTGSGAWPSEQQQQHFYDHTPPSRQPGFRATQSQYSEAPSPAGYQQNRVQQSQYGQAQSQQGQHLYSAEQTQYGLQHPYAGTYQEDYPYDKPDTGLADLTADEPATGRTVPQGKEAAKRKPSDEDDLLSEQESDNVEGTECKVHARTWSPIASTHPHVFI